MVSKPPHPKESNPLILESVVHSHRTYCTHTCIEGKMLKTHLFGRRGWKRFATFSLLPTDRKRIVRAQHVRREIKVFTTIWFDHRRWRGARENQQVIYNQSVPDGHHKIGLKQENTITLNTKKKSIETSKAFSWRFYIESKAGFKKQYSWNSLIWCWKSTHRQNSSGIELKDFTFNFQNMILLNERGGGNPASNWRNYKRNRETERKKCKVLDVS